MRHGENVVERIKDPSMEADTILPMEDALVATLFNSFDVELDFLKRHLLELKEPLFLGVSSLLLIFCRLQELDEIGRDFGDIEPDCDCSSRFGFESSWPSDVVGVAGLGLEASGLWVKGSMP